MKTFNVGRCAASTAGWLALATIQINAANYELATGFDAVSNPGAVWSCGWFSNIGGEFQPLTFRNTTASDNGVVLRAWQYSSSEQPAANWNGTTNVAIVYGGLSSFAPGDVFLHPGPDGSTRVFGAIRFTLPLNESGLYRLECTVAAVLTNGPTSDTDFYVVKNGREVVGWILSAGGGVGYTNQMQLAPGETVDFLIGRGADGQEYGGALKIRARFVPLNVATSQPPVIVAQPQSETVTAGGNASFAVTASGTPPLSYRWLFNNGVIASATNSALVLNNVQLGQAGDYRVVIANAAGSVTSMVATLTVTGTSNPVWDMSSFSAATNPGPVWSYGWVTNIGGKFQTLTYAKSTLSDNGLPLRAWQYSDTEQPLINWNSTTNMAIYGGTSSLAGGEIAFYPGPEGTPRNFGVIRFTVPSGQGRSYRLESVVAAVYTNGPASDTDYHIAVNGMEIFGGFLAAGQGTGFTNQLALSGGDTVDFMVGRGADGQYYGSALKIRAKLFPSTNVVVPPVVIPPGLVLPNRAVTNDIARGSGTLVNQGYRVQEAYSATQFGGVTGAIAIMELRLRPDFYYGKAFSAVVSNLQISLSTTVRQPGALSTTFSNNVGTDATTVFSGALSVSSSFTGPAAGPKAFDIVVPLQTPFIYQPSRGNLLVDIKNFSGSTASLLGGMTGPLGEVSRVGGSLSSAAGVADNFGDVLLVVYTPTNGVVPPVAPVFDISDFSVGTNPGPAWSYGWFTNIGGEFTFLTYAKTPPADNGVPINSWQYSEYEQPVVAWNGTTNIAIVFGGQTAFPPGSVWFHAGPDGSPRNFGAIRFTMPTGGSGNYRLESAVAAALTNSPASDTDFHIIKNGAEIFGRFLPAGQGTGFTNHLVLAAGDTVDFLVGRGEDGHEYGGALKIRAKLFSSTNVVVPPVNPPGLVLPNRAVTNDIARGSGTLVNAGYRVQEAYGASQFGGVTGAIAITELRLRPDFYYGKAFSAMVSNLQISLSTTVRQPGALSTTFSNNVGADATTVFSGALSVSSSFTGPANGPKAFDIVVPLQTPFIYQPSRGSLLVDIKNFSGSTASLLGGMTGLVGEVSRVGGSLSSAAGVADNFGDVLLVVYTPTNVVVPPVNPPGLVLPNRAVTNDIARGSGTLVNPGYRVQEAYGASQFGGVTGAIAITELRLRPDFYYGKAFSAVVSNLQINLSTTVRQPGTLSTTFSNNVGTDATMVFSGALSVSSSFTGPAEGPKAFDIVVPLQTPFIYQPGRGSLLVDIKNFSGSTASLLGGMTGPLGEVSRVGGSLSSAAGVADNFGDVLLVVYTPTNEVVPPVIASGLVVPNRMKTNDAAFGSGSLVNAAHRSQQVYAASQFGGVTGVIAITELRFRPDYYYGKAFSAVVSNLQISLSTTLAAPEALSAIFSNNVGTDATMVFSGALSVSSSFTGPANGPKAFDIVVPLQTPFIYQPVRGNLLVDIKNFSGSTASLLSGEGVSGDGAARVLGGVNAAAGVPDIGCDALQIVYTPTIRPTPQAYLGKFQRIVSNQDVVLTFNAVSGSEYRIEASTNLVDWVLIDSVTGSSTGSHSITDVDATKYSSRFYRVIVIPQP